MGPHAAGTEFSNDDDAAYGCEDGSTGSSEWWQSFNAGGDFR
jgi:hypothetical protein